MKIKNQKGVAKLPKEQMIEIAKAHLNGKSASEIAKAYSNKGVTEHDVWRWARNYGPLLIQKGDAPPQVNAKIATAFTEDTVTQPAPRRQVQPVQEEGTVTLTKSQYNKMLQLIGKAMVDSSEQ